MPIIQNISRFFKTAQLPISVISKINRQKKFIQINISPFLEEANKTKDDSLDENDFKKTTGYYGLAVPAILGEAFCILRGTTMTEQERLAATCQGAMTGLGDDFFDKQRLSDEAVKDFVSAPEKITGNSASEKLFLYFYKTALTNAPDQEQMQQQLLKVYYAQLMSKQQRGGVLDHESIKDITLRKGAESLLFYRTAFKHPIVKGEEKMLYCLGGLMQLSNDIFDVYDDRLNGIDTLLTTTKKINEVRVLFIALMRLGFEAAYKTKYPRDNIKRFINLISISIFSRCLVCLDQLEKNEKKTNGVFSPALYKRKDLICDMDTVINKLRSVKYHWIATRE